MKNTFYSSSGCTGYLTPLQRKKLRELRKSEECTPKPKSPLKKVRKQSKKILKSKKLSKHEMSATVPRKKNKVVVQLAVNRKYERKSTPTVENNTRKIFTSRSPGHSKKFTMSLIWKKNLNFNFKTLSPPVSNSKLKSISNENSELKIVNDTIDKSHQLVPVLRDITSEASQISINSQDIAKVKEISGISPRRSLRSSRKLFTTPTKDKVGYESSLNGISMCTSEIPIESQENSFCVDPIIVKLNTSSDIGNETSSASLRAISKTSEDALNDSKNINSSTNSDFDFEWPSDEVFKMRESYARALCRENSFSKGDCKLNEKSSDVDFEIDSSSSIALKNNPESKNIKNVSDEKGIIDSSINIEEKSQGDIDDFDFGWPSDDALQMRESKARELSRKNALDHEIEDKVLAGHVVNTSGDSYLLAPKKYFSIFDKNQRVKEITPTKRRNNSSVKNKKGKSTKNDNKEQYIIDAGQKQIGAKICSTCSMIYTADDEGDNDLHIKFHNLYINSLKFPGWKKERIIGEFSDGRVIMVKKEDQNFMMKKVEDVLVIVNRQLGFPTGGLPTKPNATFLFFISNEKRIAGCLVAESITSASRVVLDTSSTNIVPCRPEEHNESQNSISKSWCSSSISVPAVCGISRIWVASDSRRQKIASRLVDCLRCHFIYGCAIKLNELAFSDPSLDGREFAAAYTCTDNFLVYK